MSRLIGHVYKEFSKKRFNCIHRTKNLFPHSYILDVTFFSSQVKESFEKVIMIIDFYRNEIKYPITMLITCFLLAKQKARYYKYRKSFSRNALRISSQN